MERSNRFGIDYFTRANHCQGLFQIDSLDLYYFIEIQLTGGRREVAGQE